MIDTGAGVDGFKNGDILFNIPVGFRPKKDILYSTLSNNIGRDTNASGTFPITIKANGNVEVFVVGKALTATAFYGSISYFI